jgi:formylglycine-generating enzyme required for sulfatase activity
MNVKKEPSCLASLLAIVLAVAALSAATFAQESAGPASAPTTSAASGAAVEKLVAERMRQLGDEDSRVREEATKKLLAMGPAINPLLAAELEKPKLDPEIAARIKIVLQAHPTMLTLDLGKKVTMKMVLLPAGTFTMGSPKENPPVPAGERKVGGKGRGAPEVGNPLREHEVTISKPFFMGVYLVTQEQYEQVMGNNPSFFKVAANPVERVSWADAVEFCKALSKKTGKTVTLPTEAQWEYACRAGTKTRFSFGDNENAMGDYGWDRRSGGHTHPVGEKKPNAWGLYDMHGNVWEWCSDWYDKDYYSAKGNDRDPQGPASGAGRVTRGGCWLNDPMSCQSAFRTFWAPAERSNCVGFRVVVNGVKP